MTNISFHYDYFSESYKKWMELESSYIHTDQENIVFLKPPSISAHILNTVPKDSLIIDAFAGVGGISIPLAKNGRNVFAIERDDRASNMLRENLHINKMTHNVKVIQGDFYQIANTYSELTKQACLILDPPWGLDFFEKSNYSLSDIHLNLDFVFNMSVNLTQIIIICPYHCFIPRDHQSNTKTFNFLGHPRCKSLSIEC